MISATQKKWISFVSTFVVGFFVIAISQDVSRVDSFTQEPRPSESPTTSTNAFIVRAIDGDTLKVRIDGMNDEVTVRLLGVNTPESVDPRRPVECFGKEASAYTARMTEGRRANLLSDPQADEIDRYGRLLRNVVLADGMDFNAELVREGYAYAYLQYPLDPSRKALLTHLQSEAEAEGKGLWGLGQCR